MKMNNQKGFTLIELIVVIVILGILSAVAVPKFIDLKSEADKSVADGTFGAAQSAAALNHAKYLASNDITKTPAYDALTCSGGLITDGVCLGNALEEIPEDWTADATGIYSPYQTDGTTASTKAADAQYAITVSTIEGTTAKAKLSKNW